MQVCGRPSPRPRFRHSLRPRADPRSSPGGAGAAGGRRCARSARLRRARRCAIFRIDPAEPGPTPEPRCTGGARRHLASFRSPSRNLLSLSSCHRGTRPRHGAMAPIAARQWPAPAAVHGCTQALPLCPHTNAGLLTRCRYSAAVFAANTAARADGST